MTWLPLTQQNKLKSIYETGILSFGFPDLSLPFSDFYGIKDPLLIPNDQFYFEELLLFPEAHVEKPEEANPPFLTPNQ